MSLINLQKHYFLRKILSERNTINRYLRDPERKPDKYYTTYEKEVNDSLITGIALNNSEVYRIELYDFWGELPFSIFSMWFAKRIGSIIEFPCFLHTTSCIKVQFKEKDVLYRITTSNKSRGIITDSIIPRKIEAEVLFMSGTKFEIMSIDDKKEEILLKEVDINTKSDFLMVQDFYLQDEDITDWIEQNLSKRENHNYMDDF